MKATKLKCKECNYQTDLLPEYVCPYCFGGFEVIYDYSSLQNREETKRLIQTGPNNLWRYIDFLPVEDISLQVPLSSGMTPLVKADRLAKYLGIKTVWVKNDAANPTHSFKDRVVSIAMAKAKSFGFKTIACASTGNLANSVAAHAAAAGLDSYVFIPSDLEEAKIITSAIYGTNLIKVRGGYDDVNRLCTEISGEKNWAFVNINLRPYYAEGSKTLAYEIAEQLGFRSPDVVVAPVASGSLYTKLFKGFLEWQEVGLTERTPVMYGGQAAGCSPVAQAFVEKSDVCKPVRPNTIAKSLAIGNPADGPYALDVARQSGGTITAVSDNEIRESIQILAETTGIFTETAGGVTTASLVKLVRDGEISPEQEVVLVITGDGLKTLDVVRGMGRIHEIDACYDQFDNIKPLSSDDREHKKPVLA